MDLKLEIDKKSILYAVKLETFVSGESTKEKDETLSTKSQADSDSDDILNEYMATAKSRIVDVLTGLLICKSSENEVVLNSDIIDTYILILNVPDNFDFNQNEGIKQGIKDFMVNFILSKWYTTTWPDKARAYQMLINESVSNLKHRLNQRTTPIRRPVRPLGF